MTAYSVSSTGSTPVSTMTNASAKKISQASVKRGRVARAAVLAPLPTGELRERVRAGERALDGRAADSKQHPQQREQQAGLAEGALCAERRRAEVAGLDLRVEEDLSGDDDQCDREDPAEGEPKDRVGAVESRSLTLQRSSIAPEE